MRGMLIGVESASVHCIGTARIVIVRYRGQFLILRLPVDGEAALSWHICNQIARSAGVPRSVASYLQALATQANVPAFIVPK
jgi:hypothetical protein